MSVAGSPEDGLEGDRERGAVVGARQQQLAGRRLHLPLPLVVRGAPAAAAGGEPRPAAAAVVRPVVGGRRRRRRALRLDDADVKQAVEDVEEDRADTHAA